MGGGKRIYGVKFDETNSIGTRTFDSVGLNFSPSNTTIAGDDDFINADNGRSPFHIRECLSQYNSSTGKQEVIAYEGDSNYSTLRSNSNYNVMIEFPKFYYKRPSKYEWLVSSDPIQGFLPSPMHYRNGVMHDYAYMAKYMSNSSYMSRPGQTIATNPSFNSNDGSGYTIANFRTNFRSKGMYCADYATRCSINILMLVKYATLNIQNLIGYGWCNASNKASTGGADAVKGKDGYTASDKMSNGQIVAMGIEDYWGNCYKFTDGMFKSNSTVFINTDIEHITTNPSGSNHPGYVEVPTGTLNANTGYSWITDFNFDTTFPWSFLPSTGQFISTPSWPIGNPGHKISDGYWVATGNYDCLALVGGYWYAGFACGLFSMNFTFLFGSSNADLAASSFFLS